MSELLSIKRKLEFENTISRSQNSATSLEFVRTKNAPPQSYTNACQHPAGATLFQYLEVEII